MSTIQETLDRLRELDKHASPAPWMLEPYRDGGEEEETSEPKVHSIVNHEEDVIAQLGCGCCDIGLEAPSMANFEIAAEARNALPVLLAEIDRLNTRLSTSEARLGRVAASHPEAYLTALGGDKE